MNLKLFYKNEIKTIAANLKVAKPAARKLESLCARGLKDSDEAKALSETIRSLPYIGAMKIEARYLNLAYSVIRGKDISKVELNPKTPHDPAILQKYLDRMQVLFDALPQNEPVSTEDV